MDESVRNAFEPIKPNAKLYLDMPTRSRIIGTLTFEYSDQVIDPFQSNDQDHLRNPRRS